MKKEKRIVGFIIVFFWVIAIFYLSSQTLVESDHLSVALTTRIITNIRRIMIHIRKIIPFEGSIRELLHIDISRIFFHHMIRKTAHFFAYFILSILVLNLLKVNGFSGYRLLGLAFAICVLCASLDEIYQLFVPGRGGQVKDVLIDSWGALFGILVYSNFAKIVEKIRYKILQYKDGNINNPT